MSQSGNKQATLDEQFVTKLIDVARKYSVDLLKYIQGDVFKLKDLLDDLLEMGVIDGGTHEKYCEFFD
ncbi:hypothetical protein [Thermaerobacillus caldiproteolyticus]|uniref:hypothetical protein n=1 Tax=Thermaerobacillus caldiproteolyticus TaxID=247480 RepID=UPI00188BE329|nr:hypothetical protein [Anoxybacillus caldiproteolyticus]QPA33397.1 hypothetical protein ISX45_19300 [Anoxybacillus caldiproteolyticus]